MAENERLDTYLDTDTIIDIVRGSLGISAPNSMMSDDEIAEVMRYLAEDAPDTVWVDDKPVLGRTGIGLMLSLTLYEFTDFYMRHELWQRN